MSTRYVWEKYTINQQTYPYTYYEATYNTGSGDYRTAGEAGDKVYLYSRYSFSTSTGSFTGSGGVIITLGFGMGGKNYGAGYYPPQSGDTGYNARYSLIYSSSWIGRNYTGAEGYTVEAASWRGYYAVQRTDVEIYETKGTLLGYATSQSSGTYPNDNKYNGNWYVYKGPDNIDAQAVTIPSHIDGGTTIMITINPSTAMKYDSIITYTIQYRFDGGDWNTLTSVSTTQFSLSVPMDTQTVQVRVQAKDSTGFTSTDYTESEVVNVTNGDPPQITSPLGDSPYDMGDVTEPFAFYYTLTDPDYGDKSSIYEKIEFGGYLGTIESETNNVASGTNLEFSLFSDAAKDAGITLEQFWLVVPHETQLTASVRAEDSHGLESNKYQVLFKKKINETMITLDPPLAVSGSITDGIIYVNGYVPLDAEFSVKVTNNANDEDPVWQDVTADVEAGRVFKFANARTTGGPAFNFQVHAKRGSSNEGGFIDSVVGAFG